MGNYDSGNFEHKGTNYLVRLMSTKKNESDLEHLYSVFSEDSQREKPICNIVYTYTLIEKPIKEGNFGTKDSLKSTWSECPEAEDTDWRAQVVEIIKNTIVI